MKKIKNLLFSTALISTLGLGVVAPVGISLINPTVVSAATVSEVDLSRAKLAISTYDSLVKSDYTENSWNEMTNALITVDGGVNSLDALRWWTSRDENEDIYGNIVDAQNTVDTFTNTINNAINLLIVKTDPVDVVNYTVLGLDEAGNQLYEIPKTAENGSIVTETAQVWPGYASVGETTQNIVIESGLYVYFYYKKDVVPVDPSETYGQLQLANATAVINEYYSLKQPSYTIESWVALSKVSSDVDFLNGIINKPADESIPEGETIVNLQAKVDSSVKAINAAITALELAPIVPPQVVSDVFTAIPKDVKVGETVNFTYTVTFDDGTTQNGFSYYGIESNLLVKGGDQPVLTSPTLETINGTTWTPSKAGDYVIYLSFKPEGSDAVTIKYVSVKVSETDVSGEGNGEGETTKPEAEKPAEAEKTPEAEKTAEAEKPAESEKTPEAEKPTGKVVKRTAIGDNGNTNVAVYSVIGAAIMAVAALMIERRRRN